MTKKLDKATKDKILAIVEEYVEVPEGMRDNLCNILYKSYLEAREELDNAT